MLIENNWILLNSVKSSVNIFVVDILNHIIKVKTLFEPCSCRNKITPPKNT